jgi:hypothetical protein
MPTDERKITCYHESGHAVVSMVLGILPTEIVAGSSRGHVDAPWHRLDARQKMLMAMAGAQTVFCLLGRRPEMSDGDCRMAAAGFAELTSRMSVPQARRRCVMELDDLIHRHRPD